MAASTSKAQRIGIWLIALLMIVSTVAMFVGMVLAGNNQSKDAQDQAEIQKQMEEESKKRLAQLEPLDGYEATPFDAAGVKELKVEVLKPSSGKAATKKSTVTVNYFGWTPDGKLFDSSQKEGKATPIDIPLSGVIKGWAQGMDGQKEGSTIKLIIPSDLAYGEQGSPPTIPASTPLAFIVEIKKVK